MTARIYIVDDDVDHLMALCDLIRTAGHDVRAFETPADLLMAMADPPDMVISDLRMPQMDGMGLLRALRQQALAVPVVLLTGHGDVAHAVEAIRAGAEDFLEKPYDSMHLMSVVRRTLEAEAARRAGLLIAALLEGASLFRGHGRPTDRLPAGFDTALVSLVRDIVSRA